MKKYKRLLESYLETQAVNIFTKKFAKQTEDQVIEQMEDQIPYEDFESGDLKYLFSFEDFVYILLYACDYKGSAELNKQVRDFLSDYIDTDFEYFQDLSQSQIKNIVKIIKSNFSKLRINYVAYVKEVLVDYFDNIEEGIRDKRVLDYLRTYFPYSRSEWISDVSLKVLGKTLKKGYETVIEFK